MNDCDHEVRGQAADDSSELVTLFQRFADPLARYVFQLLESQSDAEDVVVEVFQEFRTMLAEPDVWRDPETRLYAIARHRALCIQQTRGSEWSPQDETGALIQRAVGTLDPREREALRLRGQKASNKEIAAALGIARSVVTPLLRRAVDNLISRLRAQPGGEHQSSLQGPLSRAPQPGRDFGD